MQSSMDIAPLAIVAYGEVLADGTSPNTNSGVTTARTGAGQYTVTLPANLAQNAARDLMIVTPKVIAPTGVPASATVDDTSATVKSVSTYVGAPLATFADCQFTFIIFRTTITPPTGSPA